ncbi:exosortase-associated protein EpsI, B-type [Jeongeupia chitinilytica]|uniref:Methanolan biosynthesis EpsI domain-containing protein n=1 Tax=Jeongeupia chitinilytica TaxID=1041641 RepID=A0ABQ3GW28_9NEIS|nr:exosortase-associated protein EpsI, B-type [Jeongeupia chitinilytica]GHD56380.1 hypothetical protein GCM10007350_03350 [Jeongeupia chitinilytica]
MSRALAATFALLMLATAAAAAWMTPTLRLAEQRIVDLKDIVPTQFAGWRLDPEQGVIEVPAELQATMSRVYSETLSRTYVNANGERVMLAVAYGKDQSDGNNSVHRPEVCYPAQGFEIGRARAGRIYFADGDLAVTQLVARLETRIEPISYWITVGNRLVGNGSEQKWAQLRYGLNGVIPDGLLFRVSTIDDDSARAYHLQSQFVDDLRRAVLPRHRAILFGERE